LEISFESRYIPPDFSLCVDGVRKSRPDSQEGNHVFVRDGVWVVASKHLEHFLQPGWPTHRFGLLHFFVFPFALDRYFRAAQGPKPQAVFLYNQSQGF